MRLAMYHVLICRKGNNFSKVSVEDLREICHLDKDTFTDSRLSNSRRITFGSALKPPSPIEERKRERDWTESLDLVRRRGKK